MFYPVERMKYDTNFKNLHVYEETRNEHSYVYRMAMKSPFFMVSERDEVNKCINFTHNGDL